MYRDSELGVVFHNGVLTRSVFALRVIQLVSLAFCLVYALLAARFLFVYTAAPAVPFVQFVSEWTDKVYQPLLAVFGNGHDPRRAPARLGARGRVRGVRRGPRGHRGLAPARRAPPRRSRLTRTAQGGWGADHPPEVAFAQ